MTDRTCSLDGCDRIHRARGLCASHYNAQYSPNTKAEWPCAGCGTPVWKFSSAGAKRRVVCSDRCKYLITWGKDISTGRELVGPVERRPIMPVSHKADDLVPSCRFVSVACGWCGTSFVQDLRITGILARWCSKRCTRKRQKVTRRARERGAGGTYTWSEVARLYLRFGGCAYCGQRTGDYEPDHVVPLAKGGSNSITNIVPACRSCNSDKGVRTLPEWYASREQRGLPPVRLTDQATHLTHVLLVA